MKPIKFDPQAYNDYCEWAIYDIKVFKKIMELIKDIDRNPFSGLGKPEPLKYEFAGCWSRRINDNHRLVYKIIDSEINIVRCKGHYSK